MKTVGKPVGVRYLRSAALSAALALVALCCVATGAQAASPGWKLLAVTGPTNLPPRQSETQRVTVEAEGGTFKLSRTAAEGEGTLGFANGFAEMTEGSNQVLVWIPLQGTFEVGQPISGEGIPPGTTILAVGGSESEPLLEISNNATLTETFIEVQATSKQVSGVTTNSGEFAVGEEISGEGIPPGTLITAVGGGGTSLTLSNFLTGGGFVTLTAKAVTPPLPFNAPATEIQAGLESMPGVGPGSVGVVGGPGGSVERPYFVGFGGALANTDIELLEVDASGLIGAHANARVFTTVPGGPGTGAIEIAPTNMGGLPTSGEIRVDLALPPGITTSGPVKAPEFWTCPGGANEPAVVCTSSEPVPALTLAPTIVVPVQVDPAVAQTASAPVSVSGGGAASPAHYQLPITISNQPAPGGIQAKWSGAFDADGQPSTQAGGHPFSAATNFRLNTVRSPSGEIVPAGDLKDLYVDLPPGFTGNPLVTGRCPQSSPMPPGGGESPVCNASSAIGNFQPIVSEFGQVFPNRFAIRNNVPAWGTAAEFTVKVAFPTENVLGSLRSDDDLGIRIAALDNPNFFKVFGAFAALEGQPASAAGRAFLVNPTACALEREESAQGRGPATRFESSTWQQPTVFDRSLDFLPLVTNCKPLTEAWVGKGPDPANEKPSFSFEPTTTTGSSPSGATARLHIPQLGLSDPNRLATAALKKAVVTLPQGFDVNPSAANGLQACSEQQIGLIGTGFPSPNPIRFNKSSPTCPDGSKIGDFQISTPLLEEKIGGTIYLAEQEKNPFNSLIALYLVVDNARFGIILKIAGEVRPDPVTGQLTATFDNNPQLPFEDLVLHFRGDGPLAQLATPEVCGGHKTTGSLTPWSAESGEAAEIAEPGFEIRGGCSSSLGTRPFSPSFEAGTTNTKAGAYTPMVIKINRKDGEQEIDQLDFTLPKGVTGRLAGIPYCPESSIAAASGKSGRSEVANSSCPAASQLGTVDTAAGVGSKPIHVGGKVYLAGPYKGAPLSTVVITPAVAGPFDLGTVVIRAPLYLDLETAQITAKSDPIPTILKGIPLKLRSVVINIDRSNFTLNPTNCDPMAFTASLHSSNGGTAKPSNRFQVGGCKQLKFKPKLQLSLKGATKRSGHPALKAVVTYPKNGAYSNIARAQVGLPHSEFLDQGNLDKVCTQPQLKSATCPKRAIYGFAKAWTPLLDKPLEGPVYIGVGYGHTLPDLVADLNGQVRILLHGKVDTTKQDGIRNTFEVVPDAPVSRFVLEMKGGKKYGLLENSENICRKTQRASARFVAQNGLVAQLHPKISNSCKQKPKKNRQPKKSGR